MRLAPVSIKKDFPVPVEPAIKMGFKGLYGNSCLPRLSFAECILR